MISWGFDLWVVWRPERGERGERGGVGGGAAGGDVFPLYVSSAMSNKNLQTPP